VLEQKQISGFFNRVRESDIFLALVLAVLVDLGLHLGYIAFSKTAAQLGFDMPYRSRIWYATQDLFRQQKTADLILLGASDMTCALYGAEATFLKSPQSELLNHHSRYLEDRLKTMNSPFKTTFCLAIPGEMPSDAYLIASTLLSNKQKPRAIFYAVTPRDFCDATFGDPSSTDIFKVMSKLGGTRELELSSRSSFWDTLSYNFSVLSAVYGHKWELMSLQHHLMHAVLSSSLHDSFDSISAPIPIRKMVALELPEDFGPFEVVDIPYDPKNPLFISNVDEYRSRYRHFNRKTFNQQMNFFAKLCGFCRTEGIELVVGNSPLTAENRALIDNNIYDFYISTTEATARKYGHKFVNFDDKRIFRHNDFFDTLHLNGKGGEKLLQEIAATISQQSSLGSSNRIPQN
jgi:hypothetical protein